MILLADKTKFPKNKYFITIEQTFLLSDSLYLKEEQTEFQFASQLFEKPEHFLQTIFYVRLRLFCSC